MRETDLARRLFPALAPGMLLIADRGSKSLGLKRAAKAGGADLLWRVTSSAVLPVVES